MVPLTALWLPILLSAVIVFIASSILHMVLPYHHGDYKQLPNEEAVRAALRASAPAPGLYSTPYCTHKEMNSEATKARFREGPVALMTIFPNGTPNMGKYLGLWFVFCLIVSFFVAYLTGRTLAPGTHYLQVFRVAGVGGFLAFGLGNLSNGIWKGQPWSNTIKDVVDGLIYGLLVGGTFGWLWPKM